MMMTLGLRYQIRQWICFVLDGAFTAASIWLAYLIRFDGDLPDKYQQMLFSGIVLVLPIRMSCYYFFGCYRFSYLGLSVGEYAKIIKSVTLGSILLPFAFWLFHLGVIPRSVLIIEWFLLVVLLSFIHSVFLEFSSTVSSLRICKLLQREEARFGLDEARECFCDQTILITGAAGSIGGKLAELLAKFPLKALVLVDQNETELANLELSVKEHVRGVLKIYVANIADEGIVQSIFNAHRPDIVFHAAAYKHVPQGELNPKVFVANNLASLRNIVNQCRRQGSARCVYISSDKAVDPTSVMGATKRVGELYLQGIGKTVTKFITVRFGNVINSRGSVVPIWQEQIKKGKEITITDPQAERYFMGIEEAVSLIVQAAIMGKERELFILDMGEPIKIVELAYALGEIMGRNPRSLKFKIVGLRPGEKIKEKLCHDHELLQETSQEKIKVCLSTVSGNNIDREVDELIKLSGSQVDDEVLVTKLYTAVYHNDEESLYARVS